MKQQQYCGQGTPWRSHERDETVVHLKVKAIDDTEVYGSNQMSMFGRIKETIPLSDVASIKLDKKGEGYDIDQNIEAWSLSPNFVAIFRLLAVVAAVKRQSPDPINANVIMGREEENAFVMRASAYLEERCRSTI